jgi:hypothetical protein
MEIKERQNSMQTTEDYYFSLLSEMATIMNNLNIDLPTILRCVVQSIAKKFITKDVLLIKDLEKTIVKQHSYFAKLKDY